VRLVHDDTRDPGAAQCVDEGLLAKPLGRDVDQLVATCGEPAQPRHDLLAIEAAMDRRGTAGEGRGQVVDLVLHQRDERREHQCRSRQQQRGELVGQRFAGPGRQHRQHSLAAQHPVDYGSLARAEGLEAEMRPQGGPCLGREIGLVTR
jgi:hypothetical protein